MQMTGRQRLAWGDDAATASCLAGEQKVPVHHIQNLHCAGVMHRPFRREDQVSTDRIIRVPITWQREYVPEKSHCGRRPKTAIPARPCSRSPALYQRTGPSPAVTPGMKRPAWFDDGSQEAERSEHRWRSNEHRRQPCFYEMMEAARAKENKRMMAPTLLKLSSNRSRASYRGKHSEAQKQLFSIPAAVENPVRRKIYNLSGIEGTRWLVGKYFNPNYHGQGIRRGQLQEDHVA